MLGVAQSLAATIVDSKSLDARDPDGDVLKGELMMPTVRLLINPDADRGEMVRLINKIADRLPKLLGQLERKLASLGSAGRGIKPIGVKRILNPFRLKGGGLGSGGLNRCLKDVLLKAGGFDHSRLRRLKKAWK